jgi:hypothetical protein
MLIYFRQFLVLWSDMYRPEIEPGPPQWEACAQSAIRTVCYRHLQVRVFTVKQDRSSRGSPLWKDLTRSSPSAESQTRASTVGGEHSSNEIFEQRVNSYSEHPHMSPIACGYMNIHELTWAALGCRPVTVS